MEKNSRFKFAKNRNKFPATTKKMFIFGGCHILSSFSKTLSSEFVPFLEQDWMIFPQISLQFPCGLLRTKAFPLHLYLSDDSVLKCYFSPIQNTQGFHLELALGFHMHQVPINHMSRVMNILFQQRSMKYIMNS
jgi:hypothetical protein